MPTITLNKTEFEKLVGKKLPLEELKDRISMLGTDLEGIEGDQIQVEIFPNRPDLLSEQGFARAFSSFIGTKTGLRKYDVKKSGYQLFVKNTPSYWPYAIAFIAKGLKLNSEKVRELIQLQEKVGVTMLRNRKKGGIGLYPLQKLQFPITFEGRKPDQISFRPLESPRVLNAKDILTEHKKGKEYGHLMQNWDKYTIFVDNKGTIMSMPPIINSHDVGKIDESSTDLFVECTGKDLRTITIAINIFAASLADMGAKLESIEVQQEGKKWNVPNLTPSKMKLDLTYINDRLGLSLKEKDAKLLLERMGYGYEKGTVLIPAYRADILHQADLAEDIAIAYGYENFVEEIPAVATIGREDPLEVFQEKIRDILIGLELLEVKNFHLLALPDLTEKMNQTIPPISLLNSVSEHTHLRNSLIPSLLKNLQDNQHHEYPHNVFELGVRFTPDPKEETGVKETTTLCIALCHEKADFTQIHQVLDYLLSSMGLACQIKETSHPSFITGRVGKVFIGKQEVGIIGEISPIVLENWQVFMPIVAIELDIDMIFSLIE